MPDNRIKWAALHLLTLVSRSADLRQQNCRRSSAELLTYVSK